ncbi:asparagine synthase [Shewanella sp. VB17]|uniref:asparagine synthetase B family protein n=1 Tax=Shewanella sp. VB17 TaxID=2739432 RepID=UPI001563911E|nr:asparagine synthase-related protein [Shewanella sp. VB17]NRD74148.1 asparagine synthase [Shewanella sp. VB17]
MCGIFITNDPSITQNTLDIIEKTLRFRGPDGSSGLIEHNGWKAYHSRLAIIDIDSGVNQPLIHGDGGLLVFNGEILNFVELGEKYFNKGYKSDTVLLSDLASIGKLNLSELDGFFAFVYIDHQGEMAYCARDRFGVKPLFFHKRDGYITLSSEPNTLQKLFNLSVNDHAIEEYHAVRAPILSGSFFSGIDEVAPAKCLINGEYFNLLTYLDGKYEECDLSRLTMAVEKGITTRQVSDAPIGLLLSRGIDSNLLKELGKFDKYYTIGFKGDEDLEYLRKQNIDNLTIVECSAQQYRTEFERLLALRGEPMSVPNEVLLSIIAKVAASEGIKVLLSGEGADEFFAGYDRIFKWASTVCQFDIDIFLDMYCYIRPVKGSDFYLKMASLFDGLTFVSPFETVRWFFIRYHMPILFRRLDFSLMAAGIEGREPIANMHTFKIAAKLSPDALMGDTLGKTPLRELIAPYKGHQFAFEKKVGFPVDLTAIFDPNGDESSYEIWFKENLRIIK